MKLFLTLLLMVCLGLVGLFTLDNGSKEGENITLNAAKLASAAKAKHAKSATEAAVNNIKIKAIEVVDTKDDSKIAIEKKPTTPRMASTPADVAEPPANAAFTQSGLASRVLTKGSGNKKPRANDTVEVHYTGWTTDGNMFDSSIPRNKTSAFSLNGVIKGWQEGVQLMVEGEQRRFWIPENLAYGGRAGAPAGMLVFDVELIDIK